MNRHKAILILPLVVSTFLFSYRATADVRPLDIDREKTMVNVFAQSTLHDFTSVVTNYDLKIEVDEESGEIVRARFSFNFADLDSDEKKRDKNMLKWLSHDAYPDGVFTIKKITDEQGKRVAEGTLSFHGVDKLIRFPFDLKIENGKYFIDAKTMIDYQDWNLEIIKVMGFLKVFPGLEISLHVEGR